MQLPSKGTEQYWPHHTCLSDQLSSCFLSPMAPNDWPKQYIHWFVSNTVLSGLQSHFSKKYENAIHTWQQLILYFPYKQSLQILVSSVYIVLYLYLLSSWK